MRHVLATSLVLAVATPAAAQPVTRPECGVTIVRAPDDVRYVIEQWVRAEPRCVVGLELRVVPTEGGLYLLARRADGRIHERLVPDAQSAGVLVASWIADDGSPQGAPAPTPTPMPGEAPMAMPLPPGAASPAPTPMPSTPTPYASEPYVIGPGGLAIATPRPAPRKPGKWLTLGIASTTDGGSGHFFADAELFQFGAWKLTGQVAYGEFHEDVTGGGWDYGSFSLDEYSGLASLSRTWRTGRWELSAVGGLGLVWEDGKVYGSQTGSSGPGPWMEYQITGMTPFAQFSAHVTRRLGDRWGVELGPVLTLMQQKFVNSSSSSVSLEREPALLMMSGGLRYEL